MPIMGYKAVPVNSPKGGAGKGKDFDPYAFANLNQQILDDPQTDASGAIMKKLYRIHSRYVLEESQNVNIDISGQMV